MADTVTNPKDQLTASGKREPFTGYAAAMLALCVFIGMAEGYDVQAMALAAPLVRTDWGLGFDQIGLLMAMSAVGLVVGSFLLSPLGDRFGRRPAILLGLLIAGVGTGAGAIAPGYGTMMAARFVAGVGLGLALPNVLSLALELMPSWLRSLSVVIVSCGYPLGAGIGAGVASAYIPSFGHAAVFVVGLCATGVALIASLAFLPESPAFLVHRPDRSKALEIVVRRLGWAQSPLTTAVVDTKLAVTLGERMKAVFSKDRRRATIFLWLMNLGNVALVYFYFSWLPSLFVGPGMDASAAVRATSVFSVSGAVGGLGLALLLRRVGPVRVLLIAYVVAIGATLGLAYQSGVGVGLYATLALAGGAIIGSQFCLSAVVAQYYPSDIRATASGFATGFGRAGAVLTPVLAGAVISSSSASREALVIALAPAAVALVAAAMLEFSGGLRQSQGPSPAR